MNDERTLAEELTMNQSSTIREEVSADSRLRRLPQLLRVLGAGIVIVAAAALMLQGWEHFSHIGRYGSFLLFTALLVGAGLMCGMAANEDKGARTFLALALAVTPAGFAQLGGLLYSRLHPAGAVLPQYPELLQWVAPSGLVAVLVALAGILVSVPLIACCFSVLARPAARPLTLAFLAGNLALLIPVRASLVVAVLAMAAHAALVRFDLVRLRPISAMTTFEGKLCRLVLWIPLLLLLGRNLALYEVAPSLLAGVLASIGIQSFFGAPYYFSTRSVAKAVQAASCSPFLFSWLCMYVELETLVSIPLSAAVLVALLPMSVVLVMLSLCVLSGGRNYRTAAALLAAGALALQFLLGVNVVSAFVGIMVAIAIMAYAFAIEQRTLFWLGLVDLLLGAVYYITLVTPLVSMQPALWLAVAGVGTIVLATYLERRMGALLGALRRFRCKVQDWEEAALAEDRFRLPLV